MITKRYKHPVLFYSLSIIIPWGLWFCGGYLSNLPFENRLLHIIIAILAIMGLVTPAVVAGLLSLNDKRLKKDFIRRFYNFKEVPQEYFFLTLLIMPISILLAQAVSLFFGYDISQFKITEGFSFSAGVLPVWFILIAAPIMEEIGWHSYGTDCLRSRFSLFKTSLIFAIFWGFWHFPLAFIKDYYQSNLVESGWLYTLNFFISLIPFVLIMNWLYYKSGRNIAITIIFHLSAVIFNEIFSTHPMSKVIQTVLLLIFLGYLLVKEKRFFFVNYNM